MAYVNGTTHYNLPQTVGTDKRDWADTNQAFADVDAALYSATEDVADAQTEINSLKGRMDTAETNITTNTSDIEALDTRLTTAEGAITAQGSQISDVKQDTEDMICAYNEASATSTHAYEIGDYFIYNDVLYRVIQAIAIGDTIVPDTNCTTTNVSSELLDIRSDLTDVEESIAGFVSENKISAVDVGIATSAHTKGSTLFVEGNFYKVINNISVGDTITVGTNVKAAKVSTDPVLIADIVSDTTTARSTFLSQLLPYLTDIYNQRYMIALEEPDQINYFYLNQAVNGILDFNSIYYYTGGDSVQDINHYKFDTINNRVANVIYNVDQNGTSSRIDNTNAPMSQISHWKLYLL